MLAGPAMARVEDPWDLEKQATHVSTSGAHDSLVLDDKHENIENCNEAVVLEDKKDDREAEQQPPTNVSLGQLSQLNLSAIESRDVDAKKVKVLLNIKALAQDQELAGDRRKASSSYLGTGRTVGDREAKDIGKLLKKLHQQNWKKSATTGNAEPLLR